MCHSSDRWTFWSRRQQQTAEPQNRNAAQPGPTQAATRDPAADPREGEPTRRAKELERLP